jgi:hypothetical protein
VWQTRQVKNKQKARTGQFGISELFLWVVFVSVVDRFRILWRIFLDCGISLWIPHRIACQPGSGKRPRPIHLLLICALSAFFAFGFFFQFFKEILAN